MQSSSKDDRQSGTEGGTAREHSDYAASETNTGEPRPRVNGGYDDPGKRLTGKGNAGKGPWKEEGGAGHGEDYGARQGRRRSFGR